MIFASHGAWLSLAWAEPMSRRSKPRVHVQPPPLHCCHHAAPSKASHLPPQDVVNCVGGMGVLLPLLEQVVSKKEEPEDEQETNDLVGPELTSSRNAQGMLIPLGKSSGEDLGGRGVAAILLGWLEVTPLPRGCCLQQAGGYHGHERSCLGHRELRGNGETVDIS